MNKFTVIVATNANMDMDQILMNEPDKPMNILDSFQQDKSFLGVGRLFKHGDFLMCEMVLRPDIEKVAMDCYPAVGGKFTKSITSDYCTAGIIFNISLSTHPNVDPNIRTLRQQLADDNSNPFKKQITDALGVDVETLQDQPAGTWLPYLEAAYSKLDPDHSKYVSGVEAWIIRNIEYFRTEQDQPVRILFGLKNH